MADNKLILTDTKYKYTPSWSGISIIYKDKVTLKHKNIEYNYSVSDGEPEDMMFGRELQYCDSIVDMIKLAYECGKQGIELEINLNDNGNE